MMISTMCVWMPRQISLMTTITAQLKIVGVNDGVRNEIKVLLEQRIAASKDVTKTGGTAKCDSAIYHRH
jgi:hypothetical protein